MKKLIAIAFVYSMMAVNFSVLAVAADGVTFSKGDYDGCHEQARILNSNIAPKYLGNIPDDYKCDSRDVVSYGGDYTAKNYTASIQSDVCLKSKNLITNDTGSHRHPVKDYGCSCGVHNGDLICSQFILMKR
jgi:hypothetical protein